MSRETTVNNITFKEAAKKNWFLSLKSPSPKQTLTVYFADGKEYKYLGTGRVNKGDPVLIDFGGASSYMMGNVVATENGITIKRTHALKPLFTFSTNPDKTELKANSKGVNDLVEVGDAASCFSSNPYACTENEFRVVDFLVSSALNAITGCLPRIRSRRQGSSWPRKSPFPDWSFRSRLQMPTTATARPAYAVPTVLRSLSPAFTRAGTRSCWAALSGTAMNTRI